jgi:fructokinase
MSIQKKIIFTDKSHDVVLIGEVLIDKIYDKKSKTFKTIMGGSTSNISINLKHLGQNSKFIGTVGNDQFGADILEKLKSNGIDTSLVNISDKSTSIVEIDKSEGSPIPKFYRSADNQIFFTKELEELIKNTKILHFSYWPLSVEPSKSTILKSIEVAKENNVVIGFDPNYHVDLDPLGGLSIGEILKVIGKVDIIKPSLDDSIRIFGKGLSPKEYIQKYIDLGCSLVIMTLGKKGLIASCNGELIEMESLAKTVIDTTGAGDAFWGGFYTGIITNESIKDSLRLGLLCSAYNLKQIGAFNDFPSLKEMKKEINIGE